MGTKETKKRNKEKLKKDSDSDSSDSEHELSYYINDRIKLMQQVLGLIKPKKMVSMAPNCMKDMQASTMNSLLLEELLGISNKRLRSILAGENLDDDTSSDSQIDENVEVISLDDITDGSEIYISDDDNCMEIQLSEHERLELEKENPNSKKSKRKVTEKKKEEIVVKKENEKKRKKHKKIKEETIEDKNDEPVVNVLNLLELQARARAIRSQLANEILANTELSKTTIDVNNIKKSKSDEDRSDTDSVICVSPLNTPVVTIQSNSEAEDDTLFKCNLGEEIQTNKIINEEKNEHENNDESRNIDDNNSKTSSAININSNDEDYINDVLIVTEDDITLDKDSIISSKTEKVKKLDDDKSGEDTSTWKSRWLESKKVQDVMKTTKLYNNLRQKRKQKRTDSEEQETDTPPEINEECKQDTTSSKIPVEVEEPSLKTVTEITVLEIKKSLDQDDPEKENEEIT